MAKHEMLWPDWVDDTARHLGETYGERIFAGDEAAIDEAVALAVQARDIRLLPEAEVRDA